MYNRSKLVFHEREISRTKRHTNDYAPLSCLDRRSWLIVFPNYKDKQRRDILNSGVSSRIACYFHPIFTNVDKCQQIILNIPKIKFHANPPLVLAQLRADIRPDGQARLFGANFNGIAKAPNRS